MSEVSKDRRKLTRRIRDAWPRLEPLIDAGYPLIDIWEDWTEFKVSYRHFIRTIRKIRKAQSVTARPTGMAGKVVVTPPAQSAFDPIKNLKDHENRPKPHEYPGTRPAEDLI